MSVCGCLDRCNRELRERLGVTLVAAVTREGEFPVVETRWVDGHHPKKSGRHRPVLVPPFCPFCGVRYEGSKNA